MAFAKFSEEWITRSRYSVNGTYFCAPDFDSLHQQRPLFYVKAVLLESVYSSELRTVEPNLKWAP